MYPFDFRTKLVNNTNEEIDLHPFLVLGAGETRWLKTSEILKAKRVRPSDWRIQVEIKDFPQLLGKTMSLNPREHLLGMTLVVFAYGSDGAGNIIARGLKENHSRRFFSYFSSEKKENLTDIDLYGKCDSLGSF